VTGGVCIDGEISALDGIFDIYGHRVRGAGRYDDYSGIWMDWRCGGFGQLPEIAFDCGEGIRAETSNRWSRIEELRSSLAQNATGREGVGFGEEGLLYLEGRDFSA